MTAYLKATTAPEYDVVIFAVADFALNDTWVSLENAGYVNICRIDQAAFEYWKDRDALVECE